jgi:hypothetical protein
VKIELHPEAEAELFEAAAWYDDQLPGLGDDLLAELGRWLDTIAETPAVWPKWPDAPALNPPIRRVIADHFPYAIAYRAHSDCIRVLAFAHTSRRPLYWMERID